MFMPLVFSEILIALYLAYLSNEVFEITTIFVRQQATLYPAFVSCCAMSINEQ